MLIYAIPFIEWQDDMVSNKYICLLYRKQVLVMNHLLRTLLLVFCFGVGFPGVGLSQGGVLKPVKWSSTYKHVSGDEFELIFSAKMDEGWVIYSQYLESDDGPVRTSFSFNKGGHFTLVDKTKEEGTIKKGYDDLFGMNVVKIAKVGTFTQRVKINSYGQPITCSVEFMTCNDESCLPPSTVPFTFNIVKPETQSTPKPDQNGSGDQGLKKDTKTGTNEVQPGINPGTKQNTTVPPPPGGSKAVTWTKNIETAGEGEYTLVFEATIPAGSWIYSKDIPDDGPIPTKIILDGGSHYQTVGAMEQSGKLKTENDPFFDMKVSKFPYGAARFSQKIKVLDTSKPVTGIVEYMVCNNETCVPAEEKFSFQAGSSGTAAITDAASILNTAGFKQVDQTVASLKQSQSNPVGNCGTNEKDLSSNLWWTFLLGFGGGLLALLTPCVFPMIPLTVSFFTKRSKDRTSAIRNALIYGLSIMVIYVGIGILITTLFGAGALNELSTNYIANLLFFAIFVLFALSFFGLFEITLPSSWGTRSDQLADKGGIIGTFFMAFTLALVSFSCTGPIIGSALVQAATDTMGPFVVMSGFSLALALPFALFAAFPGWLNSLPRSGAWMNSVKVVLGFLELALALKFLSVADMTKHWGILPYEVFLGLWVVLFLGMALYLFGFIRFHGDPAPKKLSLARRIFATTVLGFSLYLASGFLLDKTTGNYRALSLLSGLAPPTHYNVFLPEPSVDPVIKNKYPSYSKGAIGLNVFHDYDEGIAYAKEVNKPVLLDFTGYACVNCRKTEELIWNASEVRNKINTEFVLISLYADDRKALKDTLYSLVQNDLLTTVGKQWTDFQIANFNSNAQPLYVLVSPENEKVLAHPRGYREGITSYETFLDCGLSAYRQLSRVE